MARIAALCRPMVPRVARGPMALAMVTLPAGQLAWIFLISVTCAGCGRLNSWWIVMASIEVRADRQHVAEHVDGIAQKPTRLFAM